MNEINEQIQVLIGKRIVRAEWTGNLPVDDNEGYLLTFDDGSQVLFSWYRAYDCIGVIHELHTAQQSEEQMKNGLHPCRCSVYQLENFGCQCEAREKGTR